MYRYYEEFNALPEDIDDLDGWSERAKRTMEWGDGRTEKRGCDDPGCAVCADAAAYSAEEEGR